MNLLKKSITLSLLIINLNVAALKVSEGREITIECSPENQCMLTEVFFEKIFYGLRLTTKRHSSNLNEEEIAIIKNNGGIDAANKNRELLIAICANIRNSRYLKTIVAPKYENQGQIERDADLALYAKFRAALNQQ